MNSSITEVIHWQTNRFEQLTALTDVALSLACVFAGAGVLYVAKRTNMKVDSQVTRFSALFLVVTGVPLMLGAAYHGVDNSGSHIVADVKNWIWIATSATSSASFALLLVAALAQSFTSATIPAVVVVAACLASQVVAFLSLTYNSFAPILYWEVGSMVVHMLVNSSIAIMSAEHPKRRRSMFLVAGDLLSILSGAVQSSSLRIDCLNLDHNGLYHLVQIPAVLFFFFAFFPHARTPKMKPN